MPETAESADGTSIAYDIVGSGPVIVTIGGAFNTRFSPYPLATLLSEQFRVVAWDRRGRGDSGNASHYSVEREVEDLAAVIDAVGGSAMVYGHSSGAILALEAAAAGIPISRLAVYEPPYTFDPANPHPAGAPGLQDAVDAGDNDSAAEIFLRITGMEEESIQWMRSAPFWRGMITTAPTLPHDVALTADGLIPVERLGAVSIPTLALAGGNSPGWAERATAGVASAVQNGKRMTIEGQNHQIDQAVLAPVLIDFFAKN